MRATKEARGKFPLRGEKICVLVMFMVLAATLSLTDRFTWLFDGLCKAIGVNAQKQRMEAALAWAIWNRARVLGDRLVALAERVRAGRLPRRRESTPHPSPLPQGEREKKAPPPRPSPAVRERGRSWPSHSGWN